MRSLNQQADAARTAKSTLKRVLPALLLMSMALSTSAMAQEPSTGKPAQDASMDELLSEMVPATQDEATDAPAQSPATPAAQEAPATATAETPAASSSSAEADQPPPATPEQPAAAELDVIPVPQRQTALPAAQKEPPKHRQIEEVVVTAQKREQVSQDVPISMSVLSDKFIQDQGITNVKDALLFVPNFKVLEYQTFVTPICRGFTVTEANPAFEPPCGIALDGVAYTRAAYFSSGLFDLKRMEVLRGPQGTTFGKNATAGVISIVSKDPTDEFTANADLQYGLEGAGLKRVEVGVGGPLIADVVQGRFAFARENREGYMENTAHQTNPSLPEHEGGRDNTTYRAKLLFPNVLGGQVKLLHERSDLQATGVAVKTTAAEGSAYAQVVREYDPNADFGDNHKESNLGGKASAVITRQQAEFAVPIGDWNVTMLGATGKLIKDNNIPACGFAAECVRDRRHEESPFVTAEARTTSPDFDGLFGLDSLFGLNLGSSNLLFGVFATDQKIAKLKAHADIYYVGLIQLLGATQGVYIPSAGAATLAQAAYGSQPSEYYENEFHQSARTLAMFSQATWNMTEQWSFEVGMRLSRELKDGHWNTSYSEPAPLLDPAHSRGFKADKTYAGNSLQPKFSLGYKPTDNINLFVHYARAAKSGGFNFFVLSGNPEQPNPTNPDAKQGRLDFKDETAAEWGVDAKTKLFDNQMQLNVSLFQLTATNFQTLTGVAGTAVASTNLPNGYQQVVNAGKARARGVEFDTTWLATDWLTAIVALGVDDTKYLSFKDDACSPKEANDGKADPNTKRCDHSGKSFINAPKFGGTLTLDMHFPLGDIWHGFGDLQYLVGGTAEYVGKTQWANYDEANKQEDYFRFRGQTGLTNASQGWTFRVTALNINNKYIATQSFDSGLRSLQPEPPRTIYAQFSWKY